MRPMNNIEIHIEPSDPSVGIFGESFSAWEKDGTHWCEIDTLSEDMSGATFRWYDNDGKPAKASDCKNSSIVEAILYGAATGFYGAGL